MDANDDFYGKEAHLNCFQMHTNFEQTKPKPATVYTEKTSFKQNKNLKQNRNDRFLNLESCMQKVPILSFYCTVV